MKKFNIIKKSRKKSKDIDEKIEYLNKECQRTGLQEVMTTSNIYVSTDEIPNTTYTDVESISIGGYGIGLSGAKGSVGGASIGTPSHSHQTGVALSPPHPVTGARRAAYHVTTGLGDLVSLRPGQITYRGFGNNRPPYTMGGALWFFDPTAHGGEGYWYNLEWGNFTNKTGWGFWDTIKTGQFAGISFFNTDLSQHSSGGGSLGTEINDKISGINFGINGEVGTPTTTIFVKNDLGDPNFLPINIEGVSSQAFDYLKSAANANLDAAKSAYYAAGGQMPWHYLDPKDKERWLKQAGKETEVASSLSGGGYGGYYDVGGGDYRGIDQILRMYNDPDKGKKYPDRMLKNIDRLMIDLDLVQNDSRFSEPVSDIEIPGLGAKPGDQLAFLPFGGGNNKPFDPTKKQNRKTTIDLINAVNSGDPGFLPPGVTMDQAREFVNNRDSGSLRETFKLRDFKPELKNEDVIDNTKFNVIKKSRKESKDIDEKIKYLNKECRKTGLQEVMTTSNIYVSTDEIPNTTYTDFTSASFNGLPMGQSGTTGEEIGGAYTGSVIASEHGLTPGVHDYILNLTGVAVSPPHPVSGKRRFGSTRTGMVDYSPARPGKKQGNNERVTGNFRWIWNPNENNSDGTTGNWFPLEYDTTQNRWAFWDSNFLGFGYLNHNLSDINFGSGNQSGADLMSLFSNLNIDGENIGTPTTTVFVKNDLGNPGFLPIDIGLSKQGYDYLKNKATDEYLAGVYDLMKRGQVPFLTPDQVNKILVDPKYQQLLQDDPDILQQLQRMRAMADDGTEIASTDPSAAFSSSPPIPPDSSDVVSVSVDNTKDAKPNVKDATLGTWMSRQDFIQTYPDSTMIDYLDSLPYQATDFMTPNPNYNNAWDLNTKGYENYFMNGDLSALGNKDGKPKPRHTNSTVVPPRTVAPASAAKPTGFLDSILSAGADAVGRGAAKDVFDYYMDKVEKGHNGGEHNINNLLGRSKNAIEKWYARNKTNIVTAREDGKSIFHDAAQYDFMHLSQTDGNLKNITGNLDIARGDGIFDKGDTLEIVKHYDFNGERDLAGGGVVGNIGSKGYAKSKGIMKYLGDDGTKTSPLMKLIITIDQNTGAVQTSFKN